MGKREGDGAGIGMIRCTGENGEEKEMLGIEV